jgi:hypothetical protein
MIEYALSYDEHTTMLVSTWMSKLCQIYRVKDCFNMDTLKIIIEPLVLSKSFSCSSVWANTSESNITKLQLIENFAAKIITGARKFDHITPHWHLNTTLSSSQLWCTVVLCGVAAREMICLKFLNYKKEQLG